MPANNPNRKTVRQQLAAVLQARLQTTNAFADGLLCAKVYRYLVGDFKDGLPVLCVHDINASGGSDRKALTFSAAQFDQNWLYFELKSFVNMTSDDGSWTAETAQDRLDDIEWTVANVLSDNPKTAYWDDLAFAGRTRPKTAVIDGVAYLVETMPVWVKVGV